MIIYNKIFQQKFGIGIINKIKILDTDNIII